jgi:hypothetical protein
MEFEIRKDEYHTASLCFTPDADLCVYRVQQMVYDAEDKDCCRPMPWERWCRIVTKEEAREICREAGKPVLPELEDRPEMKRAEPSQDAGRDRLFVDGDQVNFNGRIYVLENVESAFLGELVNAGPGHWVPGPSMGPMVQPRPDRVYKRLKKKYSWIKTVSESKRPHGYRLKPDVITPANAKFRP